MIDIGDFVLSFLGNTTQLDQTFDKVGTEATAKMGVATEAIKGTTDAVSGMATEMAVGQNGAVALGEVTTLAGTQVKESMYQARGETQLLGEMFGVHLPRHIRSFIAELPGVGTALSAAFAATAVIFMLDMIVKAIDKHEQLAKVAEKAALETENLAIKERDHTASMELSNLKLDDQIAKLEGRPERNKLKEALLEAGNAADQLATSFGKDFERMDDEIVKTTSFFGRLTQDMWAWKDALLAAIEGEDENWHRVVSGTKDVEAALDTVQKQVVAINKLRAEPVGKTEEEQVANAKALADAYGLLADTTKKAMSVVETQAPNNTELMMKLSGAVVSATAAQKDFGLEGENVHKRVQAAALEDADASAKAAEKAAKAADESFKKQADSAKKEANEEEKAWEVSYKQAVAALQSSEKEKIAATRAGSQERIAAIDATLKEEQSKGLQETQYYKELEKEKQKAIEDTVTFAQTKAKQDLQEATSDAKEKLQILLAGLKEQEAALNASEQKGLITKKQAVAQIEALQKQETAAKIAALKTEAAAEREALDIEEQALILALGQITDAEQYEKALQKVFAIEKQRDALVKKFASEEHVASLQGQKDIDGTSAKLAQLEKSWATYFQQMKRDLPTIGQSIKKNLQGSIDTFNKQFSADFAKMVVTGKNFGQDMKTLGQDMGSSFISMLSEMLLKWIETHVAMKVLGIADSKITAKAEISASAAEAGAAMVASFSAAPWPIDMAAPAMGAMAYTNAMAYQGMAALAEGGLTTGPTAAVIGEGRYQEAILPLDSRTMTKLAEAITRHMPKSEGGSGGQIHITLHSDVPALVKKINYGTSTGRLKVLSSNSVRVTRKS